MQFSDELKKIIYCRTLLYGHLHNTVTLELWSP